jgi:caa(3)-type oxidase subunit IV
MHDSTNPGHAVPKSTIIGSYVALLVLTAIMVGVSRLDVDKFGIDWLNLHALRTAVIMGAALIMGLIVSMFLMGLRYEHKLLNLTIFLSNFVFLLIFVLFTWVDTSFRGEMDPTFTERINWTSPVKAEAPEHHAAEAAKASPSGAPNTNAVQEAPAPAQPPVPADSTVHKAEDKEAKKHASALAPTNPAQAQPAHPDKATKPSKESAPAKNPPSPNPAKPADAKDNAASPKQAAPAKEAAPAAK